MMTLKFKLVLALGALVLAGCTNPGGLGGGVDPFAANDDSAAISDGLSDPASTSYFQQAVGDRVLFPVNESTLTSEGRAVLDAQATWLLTNIDYTAVIEGHADEQGTTAYNLALGASRADAARSYLVSKGVTATRLKVVSYGKERPIEVCSDEVCYAKNRRAVTVLAGGLTG